MREDTLSLFDELPENCTIWNLGDLYDTKSHSLEEVRKDVSRMKGPKGTRKLFLILGNHDIGNGKKHRIAFYYEAGFDKVYDTPVIIENNIILSHEPVYIQPNNNFINLYGHTHDEDICSDEHLNNDNLSDYFCYDYDNWSMIAKVCRKDGLEMPPLENYLKYPEKLISPENYKNMCLDWNHKILNLNEIVHEIRNKNK